MLWLSSRWVMSAESAAQHESAIHIGWIHHLILASWGAVLMRRQMSNYWYGGSVYTLQLNALSLNSQQSIIGASHSADICSPRLSFTSNMTGSACEVPGSAQLCSSSSSFAQSKAPLCQLTESRLQGGLPAEVRQQHSGYGPCLTAPSLGAYVPAPP